MSGTRPLDTPDTRAAASAVNRERAGAEDGQTCPGGNPHAGIAFAAREHICAGEREVDSRVAYLSTVLLRKIDLLAIIFQIIYIRQFVYIMELKTLEGVVLC